MRPKTRLRQYRLALEAVGHRLEPGVVAGILQGRDVPGDEWMGTVRAGNNKVERHARRIQNCSSLRSNQSGQFIYAWIHPHHLTQYSTMFLSDYL